MGTNCSCTTNQTSKDNQIVAEMPLQQQTKQLEKMIADESKKMITLQETQQVRPKTQGVIKIMKQEFEQKRMRKKTQKQKEGKKKRVKVMIPDEEIDPQDNVIFEPLRDEEISSVYYPEVVETLKKHFILSQLSSTQLQYVINKLKFCVSEPDTYIFQQGDKSFSYYILLEGQCLVQIDGKQKKKLKSGDAFGDLGIIYSAPRSASIYSVGECLLAELDRISFNKIIGQLNLILERENRKGLQKLEFYGMLSQLQKNALASSCLSEIYESGRTIFNKGDAANAYYVVQQGIVTILQKKIDLKPGDNLGSNALLQQNSVRSCTLIAKTRCKLLSITKFKIQQVLGDSITNIVNKKLALRIISQSCIYDLVRNGDWDSIIENMSLNCVQQKDIVLMKDAEYDSRTILIIMGTELKNLNKTKYFTANTIIQEGNLVSGKKFKVSEDFYAETSGYFAILKCPEKKDAQGLLTISANSIDDQRGAFDIYDFYVIRKLRSGNFGRVYACCNKSNNKKYALKVMNKSKLKKEKVMHYIQKQQQVLSFMPKHPFIVKFYESIADGELLVHILSLIEGEDLFETLNLMVSMPDVQVRFYVKQIILILEHMHKYKIVYRDLKPENIMVGQDGYLTLIDFGTAKKLTIQNRYKTNTVIGTPHYMAPEIISGKGYGFSSDWWSLGILTYELRTGKLPFGQYSDDPYCIYEEIHKKIVNYPASIDNFCKQLIERFLNKNQQERWGGGYEDIKKLSFFSRTLWQKLLHKKQRPSYLPGKVTKITEDELKKAYKRKNNKIKEVFQHSSILQSTKLKQTIIAKSQIK